jgi:hypothetical protein
MNDPFSLLQMRRMATAASEPAEMLDCLSSEGGGSVLLVRAVYHLVLPQPT